MEGIKIISVNCQGLADRNKRKDVFSYLKSKQYNIYCLQDTHFTYEQENIIRSEWGLECVFSSYKSNSRGVAILFNNNFEVKILREKKDVDGNLLCLDLEIDNVRLTLLTIYGPNIDSPWFYDKVSDILHEFNNENYIICGDFNLVLDSDLDYDEGYRHVNNPRARDKVIDIIDNFNLVDVCRQTK